MGITKGKAIRRKVVITKNSMSIYSLQYSNDAFCWVTDSSATCCRVEETYCESSCKLWHCTADQCHGNQLRVFTVGQRQLITRHCVVNAADSSRWHNKKPHSHLQQTRDDRINTECIRYIQKLTGSQVSRLHEIKLEELLDPTGLRERCLNINFGLL